MGERCRCLGRGAAVHGYLLPYVLFLILKLFLNPCVEIQWTHNKLCIVHVDAFVSLDTSTRG